MIKLYCFGESGNAYKAALPLSLSGLEWEPVFVDFFNGAARSADYKSGTNEMGEAPVLETDDGLRLSQSGVILQWIADTTGKLAGRPEDKYEVLRWVLWDNHKMSSQIGVVRFLKNFLPEDKRPAEATAFLAGRVKAALAVLEARLEGRDWLASDSLTMADISCCSYLYYPEDSGFDRSQWPNIDGWLTRISQTPGWQHPYDLMQRAYPPQA